MLRIKKTRQKKAGPAWILKFIIFFLLLLGGGVGFCWADNQDQTAYHIVYSHYLSASDEYREKYDDFVTSRGKWRVYKTKIAEKEYQESLRQLLQARNEVLVKYSDLHIARIKQALGQISGADYAWFAELNDYRQQLKTRQITISQADSLEKLTYLSRLEEADFTKFANNLYYQATYHPRLIFIRRYITKISSLIQQYQLNPGIKARLNPVEQQWLIDSQADLLIANSRLGQAQKLYAEWIEKGKTDSIEKANQEILGARADMLKALDRLIKININQ